MNFFQVAHQMFSHRQENLHKSQNVHKKFKTFSKIAQRPHSFLPNFYFLQFLTKNNQIAALVSISQEIGGDILTWCYINFNLSYFRDRGKIYFKG